MPVHRGMAGWEPFSLILAISPAPRFGERLDAFALQPRGERFVVDALASELLEHRFGIAAIGGQGRA